MKKNNKTKIILYLLVFIILLLFGYLAYKFIMAKKEYDNSINNDNNEVDKVPVPEQEYPIVYQGYEYSLLDDYYSKIDNSQIEDVFVIYKSGMQPGARIVLRNITEYPDNSFSNIDILANCLKQDGNDIKNSQILEIDNSTVFTFEYQYDGHKAVLAYMKAYDNYYYKLLVYAGDPKVYSYETLNDMVKMLNTRQKVN